MSGPPIDPGARCRTAIPGASGRGRGTPRRWCDHSRAGGPLQPLTAQAREGRPLAARPSAQAAIRGRSDRQARRRPPSVPRRENRPLAHPRAHPQGPGHRHGATAPGVRSSTRSSHGGRPGTSSTSWKLHHPRTGCVGGPWRGARGPRNLGGPAGGGAGGGGRDPQGLAAEAQGLPPTVCAGRRSRCSVVDPNDHSTVAAHRLSRSATSSARR